MQRVLKASAFTTLLAASVVACGKDVVSPPLPSQAVKFTPLVAYSQWWATTEACSGLTGSLAAVQWYRTPDNTLLLDGEDVNAYWSAGDNRIVLEASVIKDGQVVRHEMLHALLRQKGHPRAAFLEKCLGRVKCTIQCVEDAGPAPLVPADVVVLSPTALQVSAVVVPGPPNSGYFSVVVSATNPLTMQARVMLSVDNPVTFHCSLKGPAFFARTIVALDNSATVFAPGETKLHIFDFFVGANPGEMTAGSYGASCGYGFNYYAAFTFNTLQLGIG